MATASSPTGARLPRVKLRPEAVLGWAAAAVGVVGIASALTPELARRSELVRSVLPPGVPSAARVAALAFGLALVWLSRSLARRRRRAWQLAVALVVGIAVAHLAKGLDFEEAVVSLTLLVALVVYRDRFDVPGDPASVRPLIGTVSLVAGAGAAALLLESHGWLLPERLEQLLGAAGLVLGFRALYLWFRPLSARVRQTVEERRAAHALVAAYGRDSLAYFTLRRDKNYLFSPSGHAFLAYRVIGGTALLSGDPVGDEAELDPLLDELRRLVRANGWRLGVVGAGAESLHRYRRLGLRPIKIGDEAVLRPERFSLEGRPIRKVRQSVARVERAGYRLSVFPADEAGPRLRARIDEVSTAWRGRRPERGFSMAMDELHAPGTLLALALRTDGSVGGFLHLVPSPAGGGYSLSTMRRGPEAPNGLMEFLIAETLAWARERSVSEVSLNFCVFTDLLEPDCRGWRRPARRIVIGLDRLFQLERLYSFSRKFFPEWRPRYLCVERLGDLPLVGLAYLHLEFLTRPAGSPARPPLLFGRR
jgi:lysyl-tRNA synthetase class 2